MLHVRVTNIKYDILPEDTDIDRDDYEDESAYNDAVQERINEFLEDLPSEINIEVDEDDIPPELEEDDYQEFISQIDMEVGEWFSKEIPFMTDTYTIADYYYD